MRRRKFLASIGAIGVAGSSGCINPRSNYTIGEDVEVSEGEISLSSIEAVQSLFTQPIDTPPNLLARRDTQFIILKFDTSNLDVNDSRKHDYLTDNLRYQLRQDKLAETVRTPLRGDSNTTDVAFRVREPIDVSGTEVRWGDDMSVVWSADNIFDEALREYLRNPPQLTVDNVEIPESTTDATATISIDVSNNGTSDGVFRAIVRGDDTKYLSETVSESQQDNLSVDIGVSEPDQPVVVSWGYDQRSGTIERR